MKLFTLYVLTKIIVLILILNNCYSQEKINIKSSILKQENLKNKITITHKIINISSIRSKFGLTCYKHKGCKDAAGLIINNPKKYLTESIKLIKCILKLVITVDDNIKKIVNDNDFNLLDYYDIIKTENVDKLNCFVNYYYRIYSVFNWSLIAKDFKEECLTNKKDTKIQSIFDYDNDYSLKKKNKNLSSLFEIFEYINNYIYLNHKEYKKINYLFASYIPKNEIENNKFLNMNSSIKNKPLYLFSPNLLNFSSDFLAELNHVKEEAKKSKAILFVLDSINVNFYGYRNLKKTAANYYYSIPYSTFKVSKIDINNKSDIKKIHDYELHFNLNNNAELKKLFKNINIIKLELTPIDNILNDNNKDVIFSVIDTIDK